MNFDFNYLLDKIRKAEFNSSLFFYYIENFFNEEHFAAILKLRKLLCLNDSDDILFERLFAQGYKIINFPGCVNDRETYLQWRRGEADRNYNNSATRVLV